MYVVAHSPDGRWLIGVGNDAFYYWDASNGRQDAALPIEKQNVQQAAISSDRRWCCTSGFFFDETGPQFYTLKVWNLENRELVRSIETERDAQPACLAMPADGSMIAAGTERGRVSIFEAASGAELLSDVIGERNVEALCFSPADGRILVVGYDMPLQVWDWENGAEPIAVPHIRGRAQSLAISPDGKYLAIGWNGHPGLQIWRTDDWTRVDATRAANKYQFVRGVAFSPDGKYLATSDYIREGVSLQELSTGEVIHELPTRPEGSGNLTFSADSQWVVATSEFHGTPPRIWNVRTGQPHELTTVGHRIGPAHLAFAPGGETIVTAGDDGTARFWDAATGQQLRMASHHPTEQPKRQYNVWIRAMALSPDGRFLATSSLDESVCLWDAATAQQIFRLAGHGRLGGHRALQFSPDATKLASWGDDMYVRVWDTRTGKALSEHAIRPGGVEFPTGDDGSRSFNSPLEMMRMRLGKTVFSPDASRLVLSMEPKLHVFDVATGSELLAIEDEERGFVMGLDVSSDLQYLATSAMGRPVQTRLPDGGMRVSRERNQIVQIRRMDDGAVRHKLVFEGGCGGPVAFSHDGKLLAAAMRNAGGPIRILSVESGETIAEITGFGSEPRALAFSDDGRLLASSLMNTSVLIWDWRQFEKQQ
jgi:WD40 repeat protein